MNGVPASFTASSLDVRRHLPPSPAKVSAIVGPTRPDGTTRGSSRPHNLGTHSSLQLGPAGDFTTSHHRGHYGASSFPELHPTAAALSEQSKGAELDGIPGGKASEHRRCGYSFRQRGHFQSLSLYLSEVLQASTQLNVSRRLARRRENAATLRHWKENQFSCINIILGGVGDFRQPPQERMGPD